MRRKLVIIAALEREVWPLVDDGDLRWKATGKLRLAYRTFEGADAVIVCAGIGAAPAARATELAIREYSPAKIISAGLAGALADLNAGEVVRPAVIMYSKNAKRYVTGEGHGTLVTASGVASSQAKHLLARTYSADALDMEAGAVAEIAEQYNIRFSAIKAISDDAQFDMPELEQYIAPNGRFMTVKFALAAAMRPQLYGKLKTLKKNSSIAAQALCRELREEIIRAGFEASAPAGRAS